MSRCPIVPAVIPESAEAVLRFADTLSFSSEFHLDLVDGQFVPSMSWPYEPSGAASEVGYRLDVFTLEVDLMVADPLRAAEEWIAAGADMLVFHIETIPLQSFVRFAERTNVSLGVSCHGKTPLDELMEYIPFADYVQLMGIAEIGAQGQPFDEAVLTKIQALKVAYPDLSITIDGSVNAGTIARLRDAGADRFITGSAVVLQPDPAAAHAALSALINA
jgi:ribulose-phosphate 3-epimerase